MNKLRRKLGVGNSFGPAPAPAARTPASASASAPAPAPAQTPIVRLAPSKEELQQLEKAVKKGAENESKYRAAADDELRRTRKEFYILNKIPKEQRVQALRKLSHAAQFYNVCLLQKGRYVAGLTDEEVDQQIKENQISLLENTSPDDKRKVLANYEAGKLFMDYLLVKPASLDATGYVSAWRLHISDKVEGRKSTDRLVPPPPEPPPKTREQLEAEWLQKYPKYLVRNDDKLCVKFPDSGERARQIPLQEFAGYPDVQLRTEAPEEYQTYREIRELVPTPSDAMRKKYGVSAGDKIRVLYPNPNGKKTITLNEFLSLSKNEIRYVTKGGSAQFLKLQDGLRQYVGTNTGKEQLTAVSNNYDTLFGGDPKRSDNNLPEGNDLVIGLRVEDGDANGSYFAKKNMLCLKVKERSVPDIVATMGHEMQHALDDNLTEANRKDRYIKEADATLAGVKAEIDAKEKDGELSPLAKFYQRLCQYFGRDRADRQFRTWLLVADNEDFRSREAIKVGVNKDVIVAWRNTQVQRIAPEGEKKRKYLTANKGKGGGPIKRKKALKTEKEIFYERMERYAESRLRSAKSGLKKTDLDVYYDELCKNRPSPDTEFKRILVDANDAELRKLGLEVPVKLWRTSCCERLPRNKTQAQYMEKNQASKAKTVKVLDAHAKRAEQSHEERLERIKRKYNPPSSKTTRRR